MVPPPDNKRRRKRVLSDSEDNDNENSSRTKPRHATRAETSLPTRARKQPPRVQASKDIDHGKALKSKPISAFFGPQSQKENQPEGSRSIQPEVPTGTDQEPEEEDAIEDVTEDGNGLNQRKESISQGRHEIPKAENLITQKKHGTLAAGGKRFKIQNTAQETSSHDRKDDQRPWAERFGAANLDELAVHPKKISDIRGWLHNALVGNDGRKALVLKGPSGAGKTATVRQLAQSMGVEILEWKNPVGSYSSSEGYNSMSAQFQEFLGRGHKYGGLETDTAVPYSGRKPSSNLADSTKGVKSKVILIEEFPSTLNTNSVVLQSFRLNIFQYLAECSSEYSQRHSNADGVAPLIMIVTETRLSTGQTNESFTVNRLLGMEIVHHPNITSIEFNPVAVTFINKALDLVLQKEARVSGRRRIPGPSALKRLCEVGDLRSAIGSLEFLCIKTGQDGDWTGRVAAVAKRGAKALNQMSKMEEEALGMITTREGSMGLFHAVGKIVYNKRIDSTESAPTPSAPTSLPVGRTEKVPEVSLDRLIDECGTDVETFVAALHENYIFSCEGDSFADTVDGCMTAFSDGDLLSNSRRTRKDSRVPYSSTALSDGLRQDEILFQSICREILFALPYPVKRLSTRIDLPGQKSPKTFGHKMYYPCSMRIPGKIEEAESVVKYLQTHMQRTADHNKPLTDHVFNSESKTSNNGTPNPSNDEKGAYATVVRSTKAELILETLPYVCKLGSHGPMSSEIRELEELTQFHGMVIPEEETSEAEEESGPRDTNKTTNPNSTRPFSHTKEDGIDAAMAKAAETTLYLSDDDIEDD